MPTGPEWTRRHADRLKNHWWWRPGWQLGSRFYTWHLTFDGQPALHRLVDRYQAALGTVPALDLVPRAWLHLTMQGLGFVADVPISRRTAVIEAVADRLARVPVVPVRFARAVIRPEAVALPPDPVDGLVALRAEVRRGIADALGADAVPEQEDGFQPHVSLAYVTEDQLATAVAAALRRVVAAPVEVTIRQASLIELHRDQRMYMWKTVAAVPLARYA